ncbi:hypothetical protein PUNSTDRAFT_119897 [Punctularia strigosozonata HHB-11173 SS5]|uniref:uncharacterized protein n=1 Tax=Punctularia strigosozonata (strain HHB-11173) TaxID=741275 RepID=UPI0004416ED1|nr:uncharacterized protein PUNSTDRAFT_119897 [Punctularia strigosozonata HHB-11173 SS5]EIN11126.1 hypothetical protein PUNSTDRAFT_119897 [Punctularia strigosozonata HHB-11173 SS5]
MALKDVVVSRSTASSLSTTTTVNTVGTALVRAVRKPRLMAIRIRQRARTRRTGVTALPPHYTMLPPELWLLIFRFATIPSPFPSDTSFMAAPALSRAAHFRAMQMKRTLSLVNSIWNRQMRELLYEFVWLTSAAQAHLLALALRRDASLDWPLSPRSPGLWIARIRLETDLLHRCDPADVLTILHHARYAEAFEDQVSIRRSSYAGKHMLADPAAMGRLLARSRPADAPPLRRLAWTTYDDTPFDVELSPVLTPSGRFAQLEYFELTTLAVDPPIAVRAHAPHSEGLNLPALRALKLSLADATFGIIATWTLPALTSLCVLLADASYARAGVRAFFLQHGASLKQLELAHSPAILALTAISRTGNADELARREVRAYLADWTPSLEELVVSCDAEWNWTDPNWAPAHPLIPAHPTLRMIGVRDFDVWIGRALARFPAGSDWDYPEEGEDAVLRPLAEQVKVLLSPERFPKLRFVRDLSAASDEMRKLPGDSKERPRRAVVQFWLDTVRRCGERGVYIENWKGDSIRVRDLQRAGGLVGSPQVK